MYSRKLDFSVALPALSLSKGAFEMTKKIEALNHQTKADVGAAYAEQNSGGYVARIMHSVINARNADYSRGCVEWYGQFRIKMRQESGHHEGACGVAARKRRIARGLDQRRGDVLRAGLWRRGGTK